MKLRLPLLLRLALLSTAAAYTLGSGCLFADDAPADAAQDDPIAEAVDEEESDSPAIGFEGYTESQLVDIQSSDSAGSVIRQMLENSTTGAVANVGTTSSTSNGATTAAESPALTLTAPAEPVTDTSLTTSTLSDSAGEGAVAPFFSAEEAAALVVASPATSTPSLKNTSTATLSSSDASDETTSSVAANGASSSIASVGSAGGAGASSGGGSASYSITSSAPDSSSSLVITTPTDDTSSDPIADDTSSDPIAEDVLEDSTTEDTTTTSTLSDSSASTLAGTSSTSATIRTLPALKLLGATETSTQGTVKVDGVDRPSGEKSDKGVQFLYGKMGGSGDDVNIIYLHNDPSTYPSVVEVDANSFYICPNNKSPKFSIGALKTDTPAATVKIQNNEWSGNENSTLTLTLDTLSVNGSASLEVNQTRTGAITVSIGKVANSSTESTTGPLLTSVKNSGTLNLGTNASGEGESKVTASSISIGSLTNSGTMTLNGETTITEKLTNTGTLTVNSGATLVGKIDSTGTLKLDGVWDLRGQDNMIKDGTDRLETQLRKINAGSGTVKVKADGAYVFMQDYALGGLSLEFSGTSTSVAEINGYGYKDGSSEVTVGVGSQVKTGGNLRIESKATLLVSGGTVNCGGTLQLGHEETGTNGKNYGRLTVAEGGHLTAASIGQTGNQYSVVKDGNLFTMTGGKLTITSAINDAISKVYTVISGGTLDTSQAAWGIKGNGDGSVSVGGVTVSDAYTTEEGTTAYSRNALTLTGANITGNISLAGKADLNLKNVTVTGEDVTVGGDNRTISVAEGSLTVEKSVTTKGLLQVQENATLKLNNADTTVTTITNRDGSTESAAITGGSVSMTYDTADNKGVISGATISNAAIDVSQRSVLALSNSTLDSGVITLNSNAVLELAASVNGTLTGSIVSAENATETTLRVSGSAVETLIGTVNVAATEVQSGTLTLSGDSIAHSLGAVTVGSNAALNVEGSSQTLNLSAVVQNQGTLSLGGVSTLTFTVSDVFDSFSYTDTVTGAGAKNGFIDRYWLIRNSGSGTMSGLAVSAVTVNSTSKNAISETTGLYAAVEAADLGLTDGTDLNNIYVVNEGNVVYDADSNSSGASAVKQLWLTGGTLALDQSDIKSGVGVHVKQDSTVNIGADRTLTDSQVASVASGKTLTLTGSGTYSLAVDQIGETALLTSGVALATGESGFTGTVLLNKGTTLNGTDLSALTNGSYSSVTMNGVSGTLKSGDISTNLVLKNHVDTGSADIVALSLEGGGANINFNGAISGTGEMKIAPSDAAAENTLIFSGDVSGWTGKLEVFKGIANVTFTGEAKEINAYVADTFSDSVLNMVVDASEGRSFTQGISADTLRLTNGTEGKVVDVSGGSYIVSAKTDLTESNVILQVKGTGSEDSNLYSSLTELASDGSSGINISDSEKTLTKIRTNTQDASSSGNATLSSCTFTYNNSTAKISGSTIDRAVIDVVNGSTLELSGVVLTNSCWVRDDDASTPAPTGKLVLDGVELQMAKGTASTEDGSGVALTLTGGTTAAKNADGSAKTLTGKVYVMDLTQISDFATISGSGNGLTLNFDTYGNGFAELYETLKGYDYVAVKFSDDVLSVDFETLKVTSKITNGQNAEATSQGYYYNNNGASGVVVYFDAIALPEPTTSTLGLLALAALCARRRRSRTRAHAEHA